MARIIQHGAQIWTNYHKTFASNLRDRIEIANGDERSGRAVLRDTAQTIRTYLQAARERGHPVRPIGSGWSPSAINQCEDGDLIETRRLNRSFRIAPEHCHADSLVPAEALVLVQAGATVDEVYESAEELGRSLSTGGASNGQTIAGACATGTHGSVIHLGGIQDHVRAVQIVTADRIVWIEGSQPLLSDDFIAATGSEIWRSEEALAAAMVHVGALGVVTAMLLETEPIFMVQNIQKAVRIEREVIDWLAAGDFRRFSNVYGLDEDPYFAQVIFNPFDPFGKKALLRFLYRRPFDAAIPPPPAPEMGAGYDALSLIGKVMAATDLLRDDILQLAMELAYPGNRDIGDPPAIATWGNTTEEHQPIANLFNGSVTLERSLLASAFDCIIDAFNSGGGGTVVTLRFIARAKGLLAPARWADNVVIDFDGPNVPTSHASYAKVIDALESAGIAFTRHWGKTNNLDAERVIADYGQDYHRWQAVQAQLLPTDADRHLFANRELIKLGLL